MNKLLLGRYFPGNSFIHRLDPRAKLVGGISFIFILFITKNWQAYMLLGAFTIIVMWLSGIQLSTYIRGVKPLLWLILFTVCLQILFTTGGHIYVDWGPFKISQFGLINGFYIFCRFVMIVFVSTVVTFTTKPIDLTDGINFLLQPLRKINVPVDEFSLMLSISLRFVPTLLDETQKIMDAQRARGTQFGEGSLFKQMKTLVPIVLPLFVSSLNRSEDLANTIEVRGYRTNKKRSSFRQMKWRFIDTMSLLVMFTLTLGLFYLR